MTLFGWASAMTQYFLLSMLHSFPARGQSVHSTKPSSARPKDPQWGDGLDSAVASSHYALLHRSKAALRKQNRYCQYGLSTNIIEKTVLKWSSCILKDIYYNLFTAVKLFKPWRMAWWQDSLQWKAQVCHQNVYKNKRKCNVNILLFIAEILRALHWVFLTFGQLFLWLCVECAKILVPPSPPA